MRSAVAAGCRVLGVPSPGNTVPEGAADIADLRPGQGNDLDGLTVADLLDIWGRITASTVDVPQ
jgi:hypothetical protein